MRRYFLTFVFLGLASISLGQNDCSDALIVCGNSGFNNLEVSGEGNQELFGSNACSGQENNSLWLDVTIKDAGTLAFILKPESTNLNEDFDFFVFGPNVDCNNIGQAIRCSTTNPLNAGQSNNHTGMSVSANDVSEGPGADGDSFVSAINANAGERYFIVIDRPHGTSNFTIEWTGTSTFNDAPIAEIPAGTSINLEECDSELPLNDNQTTFDLTQNNIIIGSQQNVLISYYLNNSDANLDVNSIVIPESYSNLNNPQQIFTRLENQITGCYNVYQFTLSVLQGVSLQKTNLEECDDDNDGFASFNLVNLNDDLLTGLSVNDFNITYHLSKKDAENSENQLPSDFTNTIQNTQEIFVKVENKLNAFCASVIGVNLIVKEPPDINNIVELKQCDIDNDAFANFNLEEVKSKISVNYQSEIINFYQSLSDAQSNTDAINNPISYTNQVPTKDIVWATITNNNDCTKIAQVNLVVSTTNIPSNFLRTFEQCDDLLDNNNTDGVATFDFSSVNNEISNMFSASGQQIIISYYESEEDALSGKNAIINIADYRNTNSPNQQNIYIRVDNGLDNLCFGLGHHVTLLVNPIPEFTIEAPDVLCANATDFLRFKGSQSINYNYDWHLKNSQQQIGSSSELEISEAGIYQLTITNPITLCSNTDEVEVKLVAPLIITESDIIINDDFNGANEYSVIIKGENFDVNLYQYSLSVNGENQTPFQDSPEFKDLIGGKYVLTVRDKLGCKADAYLDFFILQYPKFFTPNGDGQNDVWRIKGLNKNFYNKGRLVIFNRYGNVLYQTSDLGSSWDGFSRGYPVPSNDYWFLVEMTDINNETYQFRGHFSLIRNK